MKIQLSLVTLVLLVSALQSEAQRNGTESRISSFGSRAKSAAQSAVTKVKNVANKAADKVFNRRSTTPKVMVNVDSTTKAPKNSTFSKIKNKGKDYIKNLDSEKKKKIGKTAAKLAKKVPWWGWIVIVIATISAAVIGFFVYRRYVLVQNI